MSTQPAHLIQAEHLVWTDTDELAAVLDTLPAHCWQHLTLSPEEVTGALVNVGDGEYSEVWLTGSSRPYHVDAAYQQAFLNQEPLRYDGTISFL